MVPSEGRNDFKDISASCWVTEPTLTNPNCSVFPLSWPLWSHAQATLSYIWAERKTKPERQGTQVGKPTKHCIKSQKGQIQLDPLCLKGGSGNKTPPHLLYQKEKDKQKKRTKKKKKNRGEAGVTEQGREQDIWKLARRNKISNTRTRFSPQTENTASQRMALTPWRHATNRAEELHPPHIDAHLTDWSHLRENITGAPNGFWRPET